MSEVDIVNFKIVKNKRKKKENIWFLNLQGMKKENVKDSKVGGGV